MNKPKGVIKMQIVDCSEDNCKGHVCYDDDLDEFVCNECSALYR